MKLFVALILCLLVLCQGLSPTGKLPLDPVCQTLGRTSRDPAYQVNTYLRKRDQACNLPVQGGGTALYTYAVNKISVPIVMNAMVFLSAANLDMGSPTTPSGQVYAISMGGPNAVPGTILGSSLGGNGNEPGNLVPLSEVARSKWAAVDKAVYDCLKSGQSGSAKLRWIFLYQTPSHTRPYQITYMASFVGGSSNCERITEVIDN